MIEWFSVVINPGVDQTKPGIYEWHIEGVGSYIGKFTHISRPLREYERNVSRFIAELPYRPRKPDGFRHIHRELGKAQAARVRVTLTILENVLPEKLSSREQELINHRGTLNRTPRRGGAIGVPHPT
ncbi:MAG: hypothetical protein ACRYGP_17490 [Janthinobacterium lividum]